MFFQSVRTITRSSISLVLMATSILGVAVGQNVSVNKGIAPREPAPNPIDSGETIFTPKATPKEASAIAQYFDPQGASSSDLVRRGRRKVTGLIFLLYGITMECRPSG